MPIILNIESSTEICSICLSKGEKIIALQESEDRYAHSSVITIFINKVLEEAKLQMNDIDAVAVSQGPGSYTALRIGTATAKGICYALDKPLIAIDTLQAIAVATYQQVQKEDALYFPMIDARRMEVYTAGYDANGKKIQDTEALIVDENAFEKYKTTNTNIILSGNGAEKCKPVLEESIFRFNKTRCSAAHLVSLALAKYKESAFVDAAYYAPEYFKSPNITVPKQIL